MLRIERCRSNALKLPLFIDIVYLLMEIRLKTRIDKGKGAQARIYDR